MGGEGGVVVEVQVREETRLANEFSEKKAAAPATSKNAAPAACKGAACKGAGRLGAGWGQAATCGAHRGIGWLPCPMRAPPARRQSAMPLVSQQHATASEVCALKLTTLHQPGSGLSSRKAKLSKFEL